MTNLQDKCLEVAYSYQSSSFDGDRCFQKWVATIKLCEDDDEITIGRIKFYVVDTYLAEFWEMDGDSQCLGELYSEVVKPTDGDFIGDILFIDIVDIKPEYRGHGFSHAAVNQVVSTFRRGCGLAVLKPYPIPDDPKVKEKQGWERLGVQKLRKHWRKLGFAQYNKTPWFTKSLE